MSPWDSFRQRLRQKVEGNGNFLIANHQCSNNLKVFCRWNGSHPNSEAQRRTNFAGLVKAHPAQKSTAPYFGNLIWMLPCQSHQPL